MIIKVTQEHINKGIVEDCVRCPIALAINETLSENAFVGDTYVDICNVNTITLNIKLPDEAVKFIDDFDGHKLVQPFEFELDYNV